MKLIPEFDMDFRHTACVVCNLPRRPEDRIVDLEVYIDFEGKLGLCETCVDEINALMDKASKGSIEKMTQTINEKDAQIQRLQDRLEAVRAVTV